MRSRFDRSRSRTFARCAWFLGVASLFVTRVPARAEDGPRKLDPAATEYFETKVRPLLADRCAQCHGAEKQSAGLRVDSREALLSGGDTGPAIVPGKAGASLLIQAVARTHAEIKMPPKGKLSDDEVARLRRWVDLGAPWGHVAVTSKAPAGSAAEHWSFKPPRASAPPPVRDTTWLRSPIDAFILARLEAAGLAPSPRADRRTFIRRASIDLIGIPPTVKEVEAFEADESPAAYERLIDRLLASPHYGERWGRHWLDVARYADTKGYVFTQDRRYPYAYTFRDYVVSSLNSDTPYNQMILDQLAADRVHPPGSPAAAAMGYLTVGRRFLLDQNEIIDDRIDVVSRGLLGLTVTCARCHDHKFDPIPSEDYYSLHGVFASSVEPGELPLIEHPGSKNAVAADYERKRAAAIQKRDDYLAARVRDVLNEYRARGSKYLEVAWTLRFNARSGELDARARASGLDPRRLRGFIMMWQKAASAARADDPVLCAWKAYRDLPEAEFKAKAAATRDTLLNAKKDGKPAVHPLVRTSVLAAVPASMGDVVAGYVKLLAQLEQHNREAKPAGKTAPGTADWVSLAAAFTGEKGIFSIAPDQARRILDQGQRNRFEQLNGALVALDATHPGAPARAMVMADAPNPVEPHVFIRGNPGRPGKAVPRRFLKVLSNPERTPFATGSGRLDLARAIADPRNPLTARVFVNRVWMWHFGKGLVPTPSDFGLRGDPPSHPELLDTLAVEFMAHGWSLKWLHRLIMTSSVYQQASESRSAELERDPENRLLWRFNRQRLDFESMRDAMLAVSGMLDQKMGGPTTAIVDPPFSGRRTLYGFIDRQNLDGLYRSFDFAIPDATSPKRFVTTVPQQALFLMNGPFVLEQAARLAETVDPRADANQGIRTLYLRVLARPPENDELTLAAAFIERVKAAPAAREPGAPWRLLAQALLLTNEFMFTD